MMFTVVRESRFGPWIFERHPVWARYSDWDEIDTIVTWGIDRDEVVRLLQENSDGNDHGLYPVLQTDPLPDHLDLQIRAEFETPEGMKFMGCLSGPEGLAIDLFYGDSFFPFLSNGLNDLNELTLDRLRTAIGKPNAVVFPCIYQTGFRTVDGDQVEGAFTAMLDRAG
jgi:hypothetical protein